MTAVVRSRSVVHGIFWTVSVHPESPPSRAMTRCRSGSSRTARRLATTAPFTRRTSKMSPGCMRRGLSVCVAFMKPTYSRPVIPARSSTSDNISRREMLSDVLERAGITGREYVGFMNATHTLNPRRMQPGLIFEVRRVKGAAVANRLAVRLDPERHLVMARLGGDSGWTETVQNIPWTTERLRPTAVIQSNLYDALDAAIPDSFLPVRQRVALAWAIADVYDWEVNFTRDLRPGDRVEVLIERLQSPEGEKRLGRILAARE